jgi:hypothetical protein
MPDSSLDSVPARKLEDVDGEEEGIDQSQVGEMGVGNGAGEPAKKRRKSTISKIKSCERVVSLSPPFLSPRRYLVLARGHTPHAYTDTSTR